MEIDWLEEAKKAYAARDRPAASAAALIAIAEWARAAPHGVNDDAP